MSQSYDEYGIDIEARPTQQEWNQFYADVNEMVATGKIQPEDKVALRRFQNLKQAYSYLKVLSKKREKAQQAFELQKIEQVTNQQNSSAMLSSKEALKLAEFERQTEMGLLQAGMMRDKQLHAFKMEEIALMGETQNIGKLQETQLEGEYSLAEAKIKSKEPKKLLAKK